MMKKLLAMLAVALLLCTMLPLGVVAEGSQPNAVCEHQYEYECSTHCYICGEKTRPDAECVLAPGYYSCQGGECAYCNMSINGIGCDYVESYSPPTCTMTGWSSWNCSVCGGYAEPPYEIPALGHTFDAANDTACNRCGMMRQIATGLLYEIVDGEVTITGCDELFSSSLTIPVTIEGYPVTAIGDYAFSSCESLTSVTIPDSVTSIGRGAFSHCKALTSVTIPNGVTSIGNSAFYYCDSLKSVTIPNSVTSIGNSAFSYCGSLTSVTIPDSVISIGSSAFAGCDSLASASIGNSVTSIGDYAFRYCDSLMKITVSRANTNYCDVDGVLFSKDQRTLIVYPADKSGYYVIPNSVTTISGAAFSDCDALTSVTIPDSITSIGSYAFSSCDSLTTVTIPNSVTSIESYAFSSCSSLTSVTIPDSVTTIGGSAFYSCDSLTSVTIPDSVTSIGNYAFFMCTSLTSVHITNIDAWCGIDFAGYYSNPLYYAKRFYVNGELLTDLVIGDGVTTIGNYAFYNCNSLASVTIPDSFTSIGSYAFYGCQSLADVHYVGMWDQMMQISISSNNGALTNAFWHCSDKEPLRWGTTGDCTWTLDTKGHLTIFGNGAMKDYSSGRGPWGGSITSVTIEDGVTTVGSNAFYYCDTLTFVTIPNSVTTIGYGAFSGCDALTLVTIPNGVTSIGASAFSYCDSLTTVTIPNGVITIGKNVFSGCGALTTLFIPNSVTTIGEKAFSNCSSLTDVYYSGSKVDRAIMEIGTGNDHLRNAKWYYYGDANGDGAVNARDLALLQQFVAGWTVTLNEASADVNGDGSINARDVVLLQQYIAGWDVTLG